MIVNYCLIVVSFAAVGCWGAVIPNLMFARPPLSTSNHQQHQWRSAPAVPETYANNGFNLMMAAAPVPAVERPVYGIPHRYLSDPASYYYDPSEDLYNDPLFRHPSWPVNNKRSGSPYYDLSMLTDEDYSASNQDLLMEPKISQQDVINFEKYVQRYFQQQAQENDQSLEAEESGYDTREEDDMIDNDEEAARQLHLLLQQQRRPAIREIKKKSIAEATTTTMTPSTTELTPTSTQQPSVSKGQKEEAMLRPPTQRPISQPTKSPKENEKVEDTDIYKTIHRLMAMRDNLEKQVRVREFPELEEKTKLNLIFFFLIIRKEAIVKTG